MEPILEIQNISKNFFLHEQGRKIKSCKGISFSLNKGEFIGIVGESGAGKSTVLRCIYRTYLASAGTAVYDSLSFGKIDLITASEREIIQLRKAEIGYVSQFLSALPRTAAKQHVVSGALDAGFSYEESVKKAEEMLRYFKLPEKLWDIYPNTFSGGEKLRLNLAHAMVKAPRLLLLDEPFSALDYQTRLNVTDDVYRILKREQVTTLMVTHDIPESTSMIGIFHDLEFMDGLCDRVYNISDGSFISGEK